MTIQTIANIANNMEEMISSKDNVSKNNDAISAMDKSNNFDKIFERNIDKNTKENSDNKNLSQNLKTLDDVKSVKSREITIDSAEFQKILKSATDEANVETSLDLTLARDISEIITQLKEAVENASEIIETNNEEETTLEELTALIEEPLETDESLLSELESNDLQSNMDSESKGSDSQETFEQLLALGQEMKINLIDNSIKEEFSNETKTDLSINEDSVLTEFVEYAEDATLELNESFKTDEVDSETEDFVLEEEMLKDLRIESISSESVDVGAESFTNSESPVEHVVKTMINTDVEVFDIKVEAPQNISNASQVQVKPVDVNPSRIIDQITKHLESLQNNSKVNIVLNPESLGKVNIQLLTTKEGLSAQFTVATQEARDLLMKGLDGLKEALNTHGVGVDNVSVKIADSQKSEYRQDWTEQEGSRGGNKEQGHSNKEEKEKGLFEKMMEQTTQEENGNV